MNTSSNAGPTSASAEVPSSPTEHTPWCQRHEAEGWCNSRAIEVAGLFLEVTNGTIDGRTVLAGLDEIDTSHDLDTAERIAKAVLELVQEAQAAPDSGGDVVNAIPTAAHSWQEFFARSPYRDTCSLGEADREMLARIEYPQAACEAAAADLSIGGLMLWEGNDDVSSSWIVMITGQTIEEEHQVLENAQWLISCGAVYSVGHAGWKAKNAADVATSEGDVERRVWFLWNDRDVRGMIRRRG